MAGVCQVGAVNPSIHPSIHPSIIWFVRKSQLAGGLLDEKYHSQRFFFLTLEIVCWRLLFE
jgi:hypothetical protein